MVEENQAVTEAVEDMQPEEGLDNIKKVAFFVKITLICVAILLALMTAYFIFFRSPEGDLPYNSDLEKLFMGRKSTRTDLCEQIEDKDVRNTCVINVAENTVSPEVCNMITDKSIRQICLYRVAKKTGDKKLCEQMDNQGIKQECERL